MRNAQRLTYEDEKRVQLLGRGETIDAETLAFAGRKLRQTAVDRLLKFKLIRRSESKFVATRKAIQMAKRISRMLDL